MTRIPLNADSTAPIMIRLTPPQRRVLQDEANAVGMPLGGWMRTICLAACGQTQLGEQVQRAKDERNRLRKSKKKT